ncbi:TetR/AcrR family transcriptional regulator [Cellulosimicrobium sp. Marseille-Q4280]|uniref:TetR/AcrR family transcriptional regulator n=1 Tax=Cellulosimicrobium sp. Marseille-Q4280 TaxID=2937992 RepID=UPI00203F72C4|nr:TetR/AcrR family transcriptional regulator [Cellulosimicrobium sp. Marseille-Q4280]
MTQTSDTPARAGSSPERKRARPLSREERRAAIAAATIPLLVQHGAGVTTRQIADAAGVAEGTLFRAFADKDEILRAAVVRSLDPAPAVGMIDALPDDDLRPLVTSLVELLLEAQRIGMRVLAAAHQVLDPTRPDPAAPRGEAGRGPDRGSPSGRVRGLHGAHGAGVDARERSATAMVEAIERRLEPHRDELRVESSVAARALFSLVFGNALPHAAGGARLDAAQLADLVLGGVGAAVATDPSP